MPVERCSECGFDGDDWTDASALHTIGELPERYRTATAGLGQHDAVRRSLPATWSIVEYVDHVREVLFGMRFVLDTHWRSQESISVRLRSRASIQSPGR
jgi:hypothetical protein